MVEERTKLQKQVQQQQLELDGHTRARRKLEHENAHLLERVSGFEQQQVGFRHVFYIGLISEILFLISVDH